MRTPVTCRVCKITWIAERKSEANGELRSHIRQVHPEVEKEIQDTLKVIRERKDLNAEDRATIVEETGYVIPGF